jgi:UDP-N-acetylglucosamine 3-dehydrogenase
MRPLLIGAGRWGRQHLRVLRTLSADLHVADRDCRVLSELADKGFPHARLSEAAESFLPFVEAVIIVTPAPTHYPLCRLCLAAGKDVFVEKPLATTAVEARLLAELAAEQDRILQVGHIFRFDPASAWLRGAVARGDFGRVKLLRGNFSGFKRPRDDSGVTFADAIHFIDLFNFILDRTPERVTGFAHDFFGRGVDDQSLIILEYPGAPAGGREIFAIIEAGYHVPGKRREMVLSGELLGAECDFATAQRTVRVVAARHERHQHGIRAIMGESREFAFPQIEPLAAELQSFMTAVGRRTRPLADGWSGYRAVHIAEKALESARRGRSLTIMEEPPAATLGALHDHGSREAGMTAVT